MKPILTSLLGLATIAAAQPALEPPLVGRMQDNTGGWHEVLGTAGNFVLGPVTEEPQTTPVTANRVERRGAALHVVAPDGGTVDILPPETQAALLVENGVLYSTPREVVLRRFRANEIHFPIEGVTLLRRMSAEYVQASADRQFAVRIERGREALFVLPTPPDVAPLRRPAPETPEERNTPSRSRTQ